MRAYERVIDAVDVPDPGKTLVEVDGEMIALFHVGGRWFAIDDVCTHDGGPLADGELHDHGISCPRHGATFDIRTGAALTMPAVRATRAHDVKEEDGAIWVRLRDHSEGPIRPTNAAPAVADSRLADTGAAPLPSDAPVATGTASAVAATAADHATGLLDRPLSEEIVREMLRDVNDPELFVNIVDLGLVYGVDLADGDPRSSEGAEPCSDPRKRVGIDMTMTSPACPAGPQLIADAKRVVGRHPGVSGVEVRIVMDPPWTPDRMTEAARDRLGIF